MAGLEDDGVDGDGSEDPVDGDDGDDGTVTVGPGSPGDGDEVGGNRDGVGDPEGSIWGHISGPRRAAPP
ncbi:MAG: hypothetical protein EOO74_06740, partial [Myxococcales bacterium]